MPCNCDHMEPSGEEIRMSRMACVVDELVTGKPVDANYWQGYHPRVYDQTYDRYADNEETYLTEETLLEEVLDLIKGKDIIKYSLELQIWVRDFKKEQAALKKKKEKKKGLEKEKRAALKKLTKREKEILGL